jgi:hypothetical protein
MSAPNDLPPAMRRLLLDRDTLERLLAGRIDPDDAPPGYAEVAQVLAAAIAPANPADLTHEAEHVAAARMLVTQRSPASGRSHGRSKQMRPNGYRLKVVGLVALGTLLGTSGLAAAGVLPDTAQDVLSNVLDRVGISVPTGDDPATSAPTGDHPASSGQHISEIATTTDSTGVAKGTEVSSIASGGMSQAGQHGSGEDGSAEHGTDAAPVATPNEGGTSTADIASGGHSDGHSDIADENSDDRSAAGSGNASGLPSVPPSPGSTS